jgi:DNA helicase-2/ATP-dependent DNA helicase PcrA
MHPEISVTDQDIERAEGIILTEGNRFDDDARAFIKNWKTIDLQAVPGSGKTTALLAKLLILDGKLPLENDAGVVVLSHTNTAVNEIKEKLGKHCVHLFEYPNFVGTIQSFVDTFLAKPFYNNRYKTKLSRIDNDSYRDAHYIPNPGLNTWIQRSPKNLEIYAHSMLTIDGRLTLGFPPIDVGLSNTSQMFKTIRTIKKSVRDAGYLSFEEAYMFADEYMKNFPKIVSLIRKRFKYVFVDEVQDIDSKQYSALEKLFAPSEDNVFFQRIGDINQAIYSNNKTDAAAWINREEILSLEKSRRLTPSIARTVQPFGLNPIEIKGCRVDEDSIENIKPYIIIYDSDSTELVLEKFTEIIQKHKDTNSIPISDNTESHVAIGWTTPSDLEKGHIKLDAYYPDYERNSKQIASNYKNLHELLYCNIFDYKVHTSKFLNDLVLDVLLTILKIEGVRNESGRRYTKLSLYKYLQDAKPNEYELFKTKLTEMVFLLAKRQMPIVLEKIKEFIPTFVSWFGTEIIKSSTFINNEETLPVVAKTLGRTANIYTGKNGIEVKVSTIHSVKGQTHTTTLYLETFYDKNYESPRLSKQFAGDQFAGNKPRLIQSTKMAYVGMSRPTHLLCVAIHKDNYDSSLKNLDLSSWEILSIC